VPYNCAVCRVARWVTFSQTTAARGYILHESFFQHVAGAIAKFFPFAAATHAGTRSVSGDVFYCIALGGERQHPLNAAGRGYALLRMP